MGTGPVSSVDSVQPTDQTKVSQDGVCIEDVASPDGLFRIEVVERSDGNYSLRRFEKRFDPEEKVHYEIRRLPDPDGLFADVGLAAIEANRLVKTSS